MAGALSNNALPAPVFVESAEWVLDLLPDRCHRAYRLNRAICGFLCNCLIHPESYPIAMSFDFAGAIEALGSSIGCQYEVFNQAAKTIQLANMHYPGKKTGLRCDFRQLLSFIRCVAYLIHICK